MSSKSQSVIVALLVAATGGATVAGGGTSKCERAIGRASAVFVAKRVSVLRRCEKQKVQGKLAPDVDCTADQPMAEILDGLAAKLERTIAKACGGRDKTCGTADDVALEQAGWGGVTQCPDLEGAGCTGAIASCADVAACLACVGAAASKQASDLVAGGFDAAGFGSKSDVNKCQSAIVKATSGFLAVSTLANAACWEARLHGKHDAECPEPGDGRTADSIAKAETQKRRIICKACGGADDDCGTPDDLTPAQIGFAGRCPSVVVPSNGSCGGAILDLPDLVDCVDCVASFKAQCVTRLAVPGVAAYPPECSATGPTTTTTTPSSTTTTTTTGGGLCGNGVVDPGEACDPTSPGGAFGCPPGSSCSGACVCEPAAGSTTTTTSSCDTSTTVTTTTTPAPACGNGVLDPGEECDMSSPSGSFTCPPGCTCDAATCTCVPISTTTTTAGATTSSAPATTTTSSIAPTTTTVPGSTSPSFLEFTAVAGTGACGHAYADEDETAELAPLACGALDVGGGASTVSEARLPDGWTTRFALACGATGCAIGPVAQPGAGFGCSDTGCGFGPPLPVANGELSTCVAHAFTAPAGGIVDPGSGTIDASIALASSVVLTGNASQPCPICRSGSQAGAPCAGTPESPCTGVCQGGANQGAACTSTSSAGLSSDCPPPAATAQTSRCYGGASNGAVCTLNGDCGAGTCAFFVGTLAVDLDELTTDASELSDEDGLLCDDQTSPGCFGRTGCRAVVETGAAGGSLLPIGSARATTLASTFCVPSTGSLTLDSSTALPGPGAISLTGAVRLLP